MDWFKANKLTININKTECILFDTKTKTNTFEINIGDNIIETKDSAKVLGIWLDNKLSWRKHTNTLFMKIKQNVNLLQTSNKFLNKSCKRSIYYAHIFSHITYGLVLWVNMTDQITKQKIQKVMNTCFKLITHKKPAAENFNREEMLTLTQLITLENQKLGYKLYKDLLPAKMSVALKTDSNRMDLTKTHKYNTRQKSGVNLPVATNRLYHSSFLCQVLKAYGTLPQRNNRKF